MKNYTGSDNKAFTLIELLVVVAIIGILASLLLPSLTRAKQLSKVAVCLGNLHQIDLGVEMFVEDNGGRYPSGLGGEKRAREFVCPTVTDDALQKEVLERPLYPYLQRSPVFACPEDKGEDFSRDFVKYYPSMYHVTGCSYSFNNSTWKYTKRTPQGTLGGQPTSWVMQPARYIMVYEQPARPVWKIIGNICKAQNAEFRYYFHWHFSTGKTTVLQTELAGDPERFISPILFADGHAAQHDFTGALKAEPMYPIEEAKNWMWYQYAPNSPPSVRNPTPVSGH
jgi:prepilin-type N-terminal cleavage/methylation domain-containing protein/prepilin-type processing-associated H-X9-DG protein